MVLFCVGVAVGGCVMCTLAVDVTVEVEVGLLLCFSSLIGSAHQLSGLNMALKRK